MHVEKPAENIFQLYFPQRNVLEEVNWRIMLKSEKLGLEKIRCHMAWTMLEKKLVFEISLILTVQELVVWMNRAPSRMLEG